MLAGYTTPNALSQYSKLANPFLIKTIYHTHTHASSSPGSTCPTWAGGSKDVTYDAKAGTWLEVDIVSSTANSVTVDLSQVRTRSY